ncbi:MAG: PAS domain-containing protein, partial [Spirochaetales bacterium]
MDEMSNREAPGQMEIMKLLDEVVNGNYVEIDENRAADERERRIVDALNRLSKRQRSMVNTFERNIRKSERRFRDIIESTPVGICITNRDRIFEYVNPTYCRLYGYDASELIGRPFTTVVPEEHVSELAALHDEFMGRRYEMRGEWKVQKKDGGYLDILADAAYIVDVDSQPKKVTFVVDITDRKIAEQRLEETVSQLNEQ